MLARRVVLGPGLLVLLLHQRVAVPDPARRIVRVGRLPGLALGGLRHLLAGRAHLLAHGHGGFLRVLQLLVRLAQPLLDVTLLLLGGRPEGGDPRLELVLVVAQPVGVLRDRGILPGRLRRLADALARGLECHVPGELLGGVAAGVLAVAEIARGVDEFLLVVEDEALGVAHRLVALHPGRLLASRRGEGVVVVLAVLQLVRRRRGPERGVGGLVDPDPELGVVGDVLLAVRLLPLGGDLVGELGRLGADVHVRPHLLGGAAGDVDAALAVLRLQRCQFRGAGVLLLVRRLDLRLLVRVALQGGLVVRVGGVDRAVRLHQLRVGPHLGVVLLLQLLELGLLLQAELFDQGRGLLLRRLLRCGGGQNQRPGEPPGERDANQPPGATGPRPELRNRSRAGAHGPTFFARASAASRAFGSAFGSFSTACNSRAASARCPSFRYASAR